MDHSVRKLTPYRVISIALLIILALMMLFPLYWIVTGSVKDARTINSRTPVLFPTNPTLDNYAKLFSRPAWTWMFNTVFICGVAMLLTCLCGAMGGYALAKEPEHVTVGEILRLTEGSLAPVACLEQNPVECRRMAECRTLPMWRKLNTMINDYFDGITLADLVNTSQPGNDYVI